jgi:hypothetical protein
MYATQIEVRLAEPCSGADARPARRKLAAPFSRA